jgi:hypothetical protein
MADPVTWLTLLTTLGTLAPGTKDADDDGDD